MEVLRTQEKLPNPEKLIRSIKEFQAEIRDRVRKQLLEKSADELSQVVAEGHGDFSYTIDAATTPSIEKLGQSLSKDFPLLIIAEGIGKRHFPEETTPEIEIIIDPIDGTRPIMYDFRSAWVLTGIAPHRKSGATLADIEVAVQTEIPPTKQDKASVLWAVKGQGVYEEIWDLREGELLTQRKLQTSQAKNLRHGFAIFSDLVEGFRAEIGPLAETVFEKVVGPVKRGRTFIFNDQYLTAAGQLYLLATGKYRFVADIRPELEKVLKKKGKELGICVHPYDLSTVLIAQEAGAIITDGKGGSLSFPLDTEINCSYIAYANENLRQQIEPVLLEELKNLS